MRPSAVFATAGLLDLPACLILIQLTGTRCFISFIVSGANIAGGRPRCWDRAEWADNRPRLGAFSIRK